MCFIHILSTCSFPIAAKVLEKDRSLEDNLLRWDGTQTMCTLWEGCRDVNLVNCVIHCAAYRVPLRLPPVTMALATDSLFVKTFKVGAYE